MSKYPLVKTVYDLVRLPVGSVVVTEETVAWQSLDPDTWVAHANGGVTPEQLFAAAESLRLVFEPEHGEEW